MPDTSKGKEFSKHNWLVHRTSFDKDSTRLIVSSNKGTAHVYSLLDDNMNKKSSLSYISGYLPSYFNSEWSSVYFDVPPSSICTFSNNSIDTVYFLTPSGIFLKYKYDVLEGTSKCIEEYDIIKNA